MFGRKNKKPDISRDAAKPAAATAFAPRRSPLRPFWALGCAAFGVLAILACLTYRADQKVYIDSWMNSTTGAENHAVGTLGATYAAFSNRAFGYAGMFLIPIYALWLAFLFMFRRSHLVKWWKLVLMALTIVAASGLADMMFQWSGGTKVNYLPNGFGGLTGDYVYSGLLLQPLGRAGSLAVLSLVYVIGLLLIFTDNPGQSLEWWLQAWMSWREKRAEDAKARATALEKQRNAAVLAKSVPLGAAVPVAKTQEPLSKTPATPAAKDAETKGLGTFKPSELTLFSDDSPEGKSLSPGQVKKPDAADELAPLKSRLGRKEKDSGPKIIAEEKVEKAYKPPPKKGDYVFPLPSLLNPPQDRKTDSDEVHKERHAQLVQTLAEFGVKVQPGEIYKGPVITRYEVVPAPGVRVEKIVNLDKNLALSLKADGVRVIAPVPGKGTVGIEVPNRQPADVCLREIIESRAWNESTAEIPIVLGKDVTGSPMVVDLTKMPHALIAGSTGAGKTVCINAIIASLLFKMAPVDLRFIMIDPKIVEMQGYNSLPHMLIPVVTNPKHVPAALKVLIQKMEHRYKMFAQLGVRNIAGFNAKILQDDAQAAKAEELDAEMSPEERAAASSISVPRDAGLIEIKKEKLPYIVCIIDELADLMLVAPADIETCVARLAQLARAAGIHLILATQRPSVNVITGVIKANLPCRIAFKVASKVDSRTILDTGGADALIGRGDMLFIPPGSANLVRAQGAFVSDEEINKIVENLQKNGEPEYDDDVQSKIEAGAAEDEENAEDEGEWDDKLVPQALDVLRTTKRASTSMLQRRLKIGYNRAARIMELLEAEGIVGPENGSSPREILRDLDSL